MNLEDKTHADLIEKIKSLNIKNEDEYIKVAEHQIGTMGAAIAEVSNLPFLSIAICTCGCGKLNLFINSELCTKQQSLHLLRTMSKSLEQEMSNLN